MGWEIELHPEVESWFLEVCEDDPETADLVERAIDYLVAEGPAAGRPLVDRIKGSRYQNMKELRPASAGRTEIRILFAFDPARSAVCLVAGDKSGRWESWYRTAIPLAEERFTEHLIAMKAKGGRQMSDYVNWNDVKKKARAVDPRSDAERAAGKQMARERHEAYVRGYQLAEMRKAAGVTQAELAESLGVSQARISKIESGEVSGVDVIRAYVTALGGTLDLVATLGDRTWRVA